MKLTRALVVGAITCGLAAASIQAGSGELGPTSIDYAFAGRDQAGRELGTNRISACFIDGNRVATLGYGRSFKGALPAGLHLVAMRQTPHLNDAYPYSHSASD